MKASAHFCLDDIADLEWLWRLAQGEIGIRSGDEQRTAKLELGVRRIFGGKSPDPMPDHAEKARRKGLRIQRIVDRLHRDGGGYVAVLYALHGPENPAMFRVGNEVAPTEAAARAIRPEEVEALAKFTDVVEQRRTELERLALIQKIGPGFFFEEIGRLANLNRVAVTTLAAADDGNARGGEEFKSAVQGQARKLRDTARAAYANHRREYDREQKELRAIRHREQERGRAEARQLRADMRWARIMGSNIMGASRGA